MKKTTSKTRAYRTEMNDKILNSGFRDFNKFFALDNKAYIDGALNAKTKELMGIASSMVLRCNDCIFYHIDRSIQEGATREELMETFNAIPAVTGKPTMVIANTIKGKGVSFMENKYEWHNKVPSDEQFKLAYKELQKMK